MYDEPFTATNDDIMAAYKLLPNGEGFWWKEWINETFIKVEKITTESLHELNELETQFHVVCLAERELFAPFFEHLEFAFFPPMSDITDECSFRLFKWEDMDWSIASVPIAKANTCYLAASAVGCRLANGVPHVFSMAGGGRGIGNCRNRIGREPQFAATGVKESIFPLNTERVVTLEPRYPGRGPKVGMVGLVDPAPVPQPREPDLLDVILARRKKR